MDTPRLLSILAVLGMANGQNGPHVPDHGVVANAEGQLYGAPKMPSEPLGAAASYAPSGYKSYGGETRGGGYDNSGYSGNNNNYGGGSYGGNSYSYGGSEAGYVGNGGCYGRPAGVYGDASYDCKTFQVCQADGRLDTLYCPPYTRFNNYLGVCDWHFKVDAYCNPLYKEESYGNNNNYQSSYGGDNYSSKGQNYGGNNYGNSYDKSSNYGSPSSNYGGNSYSSASTNYEAGAAAVAPNSGVGYSAGYRTPVYSLQAFPAQQVASGQAQKY